MMNFNDIVGQRVIVESLRNAVINGMISNGYIFSGPEGCGKKLMAGIFSMALNAREGNEDPAELHSCIRKAIVITPTLKLINQLAEYKNKTGSDILSDTARKVL